MSAERVIAGYLRIASEDLQGAKLLLQAGNRNAFYLCEQAAEKVIRAILTSEGLHGGTTHQLRAMVDLVPDENAQKAALRRVEELSAYATAWRYPTGGGRIPLTNTNLVPYIRRVEHLLDVCTAHFGVELQGEGAATTAAPLR